MSHTRRMVETVAHVTDHVYPRLPVRQWVLCVPKRLCYFMQRDGAVLNMVLRIFLRVIAQSLHSNSPEAAQVDKAALQIGAVAFIHRFGSNLNAHVHFHVCLVDGVLRLWRDRWTSWKRVFVAVSKRNTPDLGMLAAECQLCGSAFVQLIDCIGSLSVIEHASIVFAQAQRFRQSQTQTLVTFWSNCGDAQ